MLCSLLAYDAAGNVIGTLDSLVEYDAAGDPVGMVDFAAYEETGEDLTSLFRAGAGVGCVTWPEWLGGAAHRFRVELVGPPGRRSAQALVHRVSGHRRERPAIEAAIRERLAAAGRRPADLRDLVGGPGRPLPLDADGRTRPRPDRPAVPLIGRPR